MDYLAASFFAASSSAFLLLALTVLLADASEQFENSAFDSEEAPSISLIPLASHKHVQTYS